MSCRIGSGQVGLQPGPVMESPAVQACSRCLPCRLVLHPGHWLPAVPAIVFFRLFVLHNNKNVGLFVCPGRSTVDLELGYIEYTLISQHDTTL